MEDDWGTLKSDLTHLFLLNACTKSGPLEAITVPQHFCGAYLTLSDCVFRLVCYYHYYTGSIILTGVRLDKFHHKKYCQFSQYAT